MATLQARLFDRLGREVPMVALFKYPTIRDLAAYLGGVEPLQPLERESPGLTAPRAAAGQASRANRRDLRRVTRQGGGDE
jgi:hypothetical protein